jgi:proline racemase
MAVLPSITGTAYITAEAVLLVDAEDPLRDGIR